MAFTAIYGLLEPKRLSRGTAVPVQAGTWYHLMLRPIVEKEKGETMRKLAAFGCLHRETAPAAGLSGERHLLVGGVL